jgi:hypothetical protein
VIVENEPEPLLTAMEAHRPPHVPQWESADKTRLGT